ncbi:MAG TPA: FAD-binding protein [Stellaceae bacterium]|nr:FAD-binding protein [Stellaceae bacterium]
MSTDVLVIGGGPAASWAGIAAAEAGAKVIVVDKGYLGTSGATAPSNTGTWFVPPERRHEAVNRRLGLTGGLADADCAHRTLDMAWNRLHQMAEWGYPFPTDDDGKPYLANLRGPDYMHFMRRRLRRIGVKVFDHHPALELLNRDGVIAGAAGIDRQRGRNWRVHAGAVVLATGGCAFGERILGATGLTGDGYLMAAEAGAVMSGMEFSAQYALTPKPSALNKGLPFRWASFYREDGTRVVTEGQDRHVVVAQALLEGPVYARYDKAGPELRQWLRQGQPNCFLPLDRSGVDAFEERWPVTLRCEGTVRGVGGISLAGDDCSTGVPGLYAAGDAASRERLTGAITGGGGPNSSWAIASGNWAGQAAARFARENRRAGAAPVIGIGGNGLRPAAPPADDFSAADAMQMVRAEMLPLDHNFFRTAPGLQRSLARLDDGWRALNGQHAAALIDALRLREAAALTASSRWAFSAALARVESRGMHRRRDATATDARLTCAIETGGLDHIQVAHRQHAWQRTAQ